VQIFDTKGKLLYYFLVAARDAAFVVLTIAMALHYLLRETQECN
jgi:hypothetical protein